MKYDKIHVSIAYDRLTHDQVEQIYPFLDALPIELCKDQEITGRLELVLSSPEANVFVLDKRKKGENLICQNLEEISAEDYYVQLSGNNDDGIDLSIIRQEDGLKLIISSNGRE